MLNRSIIAYLDILGYTDNVRADEAGFLERLLKIVGEWKESVSRLNMGTALGFGRLLNEQLEPGGDIPTAQYNLFSDNICITIPCVPSKDDVVNKTNLYHFLVRCAWLHLELIFRYGMVIRGGLTVGNIFRNDEIIYGSGLIDAHELEQSVHFPCIQIGKAASELANANNEITPYFLSLNCLDVTILDYLKLLNNNQEILAGTWEKRLKVHGEFIKNELCTLPAEHKIFKKYKWLEWYHNDFCSKNGYANFLI